MTLQEPRPIWANGESQETVGIEVAEVAGAQPAVDQGRGGRLRRVPVPGHDVVAAGTDLAGLARRSFTAVHSPHPDLDAVDRRADRAELVVQPLDRKSTRLNSSP